MKKFKFQIGLLLLLFNTSIYAQTTYYVNQQNGSDTKSGKKITTAFKTFEKAIENILAGDTIEIIGEYTNPSYNVNYTFNTVHDAQLWHAENTIRINGLNGTSGNYITIKARDNTSVLKGDGGNVIRITNSSFLKIEGFIIEGEVDRIPMSTANALQFVYLLDNTSLQGTTTAPLAADIKFRNKDEINDTDNVVEETDIYTDISNENVVRPSYIDTRGIYVSASNNIILRKNTIHHTPGGGLRVSDSKYIEILENEIYKCSARSYSGTHALVVTKTEPINSSGYSVTILRNHIHHNYNEQFSWAPDKTKITPKIDEGKGISLQRNNLDTWLNGIGRILVANNLCYWNGFSGVHTNDGNRIDFINNTCYMNSYTNTVTYAGQSQSGNNIGISAQSSDDIKIINNISVIDTNWGGFALSAGETTNLVISDNMIFGINGTVNQDSDITNFAVNTKIKNPLFVDSGGYSAATYNFNLQINSPAVDVANKAFAPNDDFFGKVRDITPDFGALEYDKSLSTPEISNQDLVFFVDNVNTLHIKGLVDYPVKIKIFDLSGRELLATIIQSNVLGNSIILNNFQNGIYIVNLIAKDSVKAKKIFLK